MIDLKAEQSALYELMQTLGLRGFLRICQTDDSLWVSDCPRRTPDLVQAQRALEERGYSCRLDARTQLWHLDWMDWSAHLDGLPRNAPHFPQQERYHKAYALCRLWLSHPHEQTALPVARRLLKLTAGPEEALLAAVPALYEETAAAVREGRPAGYEAGKLLAQWLLEHMKGEDT